MASLETWIDGQVKVNDKGSNAAPVQITIEGSFNKDKGVTLGFSRDEARFLVLDMMEVLQAPEELYDAVHKWLQEKS